jgi:hypothetical protein
VGGTIAPGGTPPPPPPEDENTGGRRRGRKTRKNGIVQGVYRGTTGLAKGTLRSVGRLGRSVFGRGGGECIDGKDSETGMDCQ